MPPPGSPRSRAGRSNGSRRSDRRVRTAPGGARRSGGQARGLFRTAGLASSAGAIRRGRARTRRSARAGPLPAPRAGRRWLPQGSGSGATTAAAPCASRSASTTARSASQPVVAMTNRRQPAPSAAPTLPSTASDRDASTVRPGVPRSARPWRSTRRPAEQSGRRASSAKGRGDRLTERPVAENDRIHRWSLAIRRGAAVPGATKKTAVTVLVFAAPGASDPGGPCRSSSVRAVRAPGPVPPGRAARASSWPHRSGSGCAYCKYCA